MGIQGLLPLLKSIQHSRHISDYRGQTLAVDGYCWLHKGAFSCAVDICLGKQTIKYVEYCMERVRFLLNNGVTPYLVFDGGHLPMKKRTESQREQKRKDNLQRGQELWEKGDRKKAVELFQACIDVTPTMASQFIRALKKEGVKYVVAPYEADAQLAFLEFQGLVDGIITEDSDLLVFGCKKVLFKMSRSGDVFEVLGSEIADTTDIDIRGWSLEKFRQMCILSGCDYLANLPGVGLRTAYKLLKKHRDVEKLIRSWSLEKKSRVDPEYLKNFRKAELTFQYQRVYDPVSQCIVSLHPMENAGSIEEEFGDLSFLGDTLDDPTARKIAEGLLDPISSDLIQTLATPVKGAVKRTLQRSQPLPAGFSGFRKFQPQSQPVLASTSATLVQREERVTIKKKKNISGTASRFFTKTTFKESTTIVSPATKTPKPDVVVFSGDTPKSSGEQFRDVLDEESAAEEAVSPPKPRPRLIQLIQKFRYREKAKPSIGNLGDLGKRKRAN